MTRPAIDVAEEEIEEGLLTEHGIALEPDDVRRLAANVIAALWDAGYSITPSAPGRVVDADG